jgi:DNA polymerase III epsilon subunit-like protein
MKHKKVRFRVKKFAKVLVGDWETSGLPPDEPRFDEGPQGIQMGFCVVEDPYEKWEIVDEFRADVQWLGPTQTTQGLHPDLVWSSEAERIHGITQASLLTKPHPQMIAQGLVPMLKRHWPGEKIILGGHNPGFDMYFTKQFLWFAGASREVRLDHRMLDSSTLGFFTLGISNSDDLFLATSGSRRGKHDALEDARLTVGAFRELTRHLRPVFPLD